MRKIIERNPHITILGNINTKYFIKDEPSYGIEAKAFARTGQTDFTSTKNYSEKSTLIDVVDARLIELELLINTNCIL